MEGNYSSVVSIREKTIDDINCLISIVGKDLVEEIRKKILNYNTKPYIFMAETTEGDVAGFAVGYSDFLSYDGNIASIFVKKEYRDLYLGTKLFEKLKQRLKADIIVVENTSNDDTNAFFNALGFKLGFLNKKNGVVLYNKNAIVGANICKLQPEKISSLRQIFEKYMNAVTKKAKRERDISIDMREWEDIEEDLRQCHIIVVKDCSGKIVGFVSAFIENGLAYMQDLFSEPKFNEILKNELKESIKAELKINILIEENILKCICDVE